MTVRLLASAALLASGVASAQVMSDPFEPDNTIATAKLLVYNEAPQAHSFHEISDTDWFKVELFVGVVYNVYITPRPPYDTSNDDCRLRFSLLDPEGLPVADLIVPVEDLFTCYGPPHVRNFELDALGGSYTSGTYYIRVDPLDAAESGNPFDLPETGNYEIAIAESTAPPSGRVAATLLNIVDDTPIVDARFLLRFASTDASHTSTRSQFDGTVNLPADPDTFEVRIAPDGFQAIEWTLTTTVMSEMTTSLGTIRMTPTFTPTTPDVSNLAVVGTPTATGANVQSIVAAGGAQTTVNFRVRELPNGTFGNPVPDIVDDPDTTANAALGGLACGKSYEARVSATNAIGADPADTPDEFATFASEACAPVQPVIQSISASAAANSATLMASVLTNNETTFVRFDYRVAGSPSFSTTAETQYAGSPTASASAFVPGLACNTTYDFRAIARNAATQPVTSSIDQFATSACPPPGISTLQANNVQRTSATVAGDVTTNGQAVVGHVEYRVGAGAWTIASNFNLTDQPGPQTVSGNLVGLACGTLHEYRVRLTQPAPQEANSMFTTSACTPPTINSTSVPTVTLTSATLQASIGTNSLPYQLYFEYRVQGSGGAWTPTETLNGLASPTSQSMTSPVAGLACSTTYEYRAVATNVDGTTMRTGMPGATTIDCSALIFQSGFE